MVDFLQDIEKNWTLTIGELIEEALNDGDDWSVSRLKRSAQSEFNQMVVSNGELPSIYADVREDFREYSALPDYKPHDRLTEIREHFDITINSDGSYSRHPKGSMPYPCTIDN